MVGAMRAVDDDMMARVEKAELMRQLTKHEKEAAEIRSRLGLVQREKLETVDIRTASQREGITRMRTDHIAKMVDQGKLTDSEAQAAAKFRSIWEALSRGLFPGGADRLVGTQSRGTYRHPLEKMDDEEFFVWFYEYLPWSKVMGAKPAISKDNFSLSYLKICYAIIVDGYGPAQCEKMWPVAKGKGVVMTLFKRALRAWQHLDYAPEAQLEGIRRQIIDDAKRRTERAIKDVNDNRTQRKAP